MDYKRVLRLHYVNGYSSRTIGKQTYDGKSTVAEFLKRFEECKELKLAVDKYVADNKNINLYRSVLYIAMDLLLWHKKTIETDYKTFIKGI